MLAVTFSGGDKMMRSIVSTAPAPRRGRPSAVTKLCPFSCPAAARGWRWVPLWGRGGARCLSGCCTSGCVCAAADELGGVFPLRGEGGAWGQSRAFPRRTEPGSCRWLCQCPPSLRSRGTWECRELGAASGPLNHLAQAPSPFWHRRFSQMNFSEYFYRLFLFLPKNDFLSTKCPFYPSQAARPVRSSPRPDPLHCSLGAGALGGLSPHPALGCQRALPGPGHLGPFPEACPWHSP